MHVGKLYIYDNIVNHKGVVSYYYQIRPINSLFASESQCSTLLDDMIKVICDVNMPGGIVIKPQKIDNNKIYKAYANNFKKHAFKDKNGKPIFLDFAKDYIESLKEILSVAIKYRYQIYFVFTDGRDELKKRLPIKLFDESTKPLTKRTVELYQLVEEEIYKQLSKTVQGIKLTSKQTERLNNYIATSIDDELVDYEISEHPGELENRFLKVNSRDWKTMYTRTHVVSSINTTEVIDSSKADLTINKLQLSNFPTDVFVKFDLEHTKEFRKNMSARQEKIHKDHKLFFSLSNRKDKKSIEAEKIAKIGAESDSSIEESKINFQMYIRIRANDKKTLDKRSDALRSKLESKKRFQLSNELGSQITIANALFPYRSHFGKYINSTDISFFARYNFLGGLYIGEEEEGMIISYTVPGGIPIFHDLSKKLEGKTKTSSPVIAFVGETGAGKTQQADLEAFQNMIFKGMMVLTIDPKNDREKKINMLGDNASVLKIGSKDCVNGMFDPYLIINDSREQLSQVLRDIDGMVHILKLRNNTDYDAIEKAHNEMLEDKYKGLIKQCTLSYLLENKLMKYDEYTAKQVLTLRNDSMMRLFFGTQDTDINEAFTLNKPYNLITFERLPMDIKNKNWDFDPNRIDHAIFAMTFSRVQWLIESFMKMFPGREKIIVFDEYKVYQRTPGGEQIVDNAARQARTWLEHVFIITQELSSISSDILNNVGEIFVGSLKSSQEIDHILNEMKLNNHATIRSALIDRTTDEGVNDEKKYNFLMQDYNNRKCLTKNRIPRCFSEVFKTLKEEDVEKLESVAIGNTFFDAEGKDQDVIYDE